MHQAQFIVVPTKECRSISSTSYISYLLAAHGKKINLAGSIRHSTNPSSGIETKFIVVCKYIHIGSLFFTKYFSRPLHILLFKIISALFASAHTQTGQAKTIILKIHKVYSCGIDSSWKI
jgi:hypothetical protein